MNHPLHSNKKLRPNSQLISSPADSQTLAVTAGPIGFVDRIARSQVLKRLTKIRFGCLRIHENGRLHSFGSVSADHWGIDEPVVEMTISQAGVWRDLALGGTVGGGEAYMRGGWQCNDIVALVRLLLRNAEVLDDLDSNLLLLTKPIDRLLNRLTRNTRDGSRKNIAAHYDLGNDFFKLFLDPKMMYSSAFYTHADSTLDQAAVSKLDRICQKMNLTAEDRVIEIGTGWGGFAIHAAQHYGCHVTTATISKQQYELAKQRVDEAGLNDRVTLLLQDYRDLDGEYDKLVSIEMIEAVGHQFLDTYFKQCSKLLKPAGLMCIQAITISDQFYQRAISEVDFIKKYIFPGGFLPSISAMSASVCEVTNLKIIHLEDIGLHYARTLVDWRERFLANIEAVKAMGYPPAFIRMWEFYLCYCEGSFRENYIGNVQLVMSKPRAMLPTYNPQIEQV